MTLNKSVQQNNSVREHLGNHVLQLVSYEHRPVSNTKPETRIAQFKVLNTTATSLVPGQYVGIPMKNPMSEKREIFYIAQVQNLLAAIHGTDQALVPEETWDAKEADAIAGKCVGVVVFCSVIEKTLQDGRVVRDTLFFPKPADATAAAVA